MTDAAAPTPIRRCRLLSFRQALDCEQGRTKRCVCRCRGTLHGAKRFGDAPSYRKFMDLDRADPHRVPWRRNTQPDLLTLVEEAPDAVTV